MHSINQNFHGKTFKIGALKHASAKKLQARVFAWYTEWLIGSQKCAKMCMEMKICAVVIFEN